MKHIKYYITFIIILLCALTYLFYNKNSNGNNPAKSNLYTEEGKTVVGFCIDTIVIERFQKDVDIFKSKAEEMGLDVEVFNAYGSSDEQIKQINKLIEQGASAIVIIPCDRDSLSEVIAKAKEKGVYIVAYDRLINYADVDVYVSFDNVKVGELMAGALVEKVATGNYVIINGSPKDQNSYMFNQGYYNVLDRYVKRGDIQIVEEVWADNWDEEVAIECVNRLLEEGVQIDAIIGANDRLAEGAIDVLSEYGMVGSVQVVGHDADISACQRIVEGKQLMTVYKPIKNLAEGAVEVVTELIKGEVVVAPRTVYNGEYVVPYVKYDVIAVDANNMKETVIADRFHIEEDVYLNVTGNN